MEHTLNQGNVRPCTFMTPSLVVMLGASDDLKYRVVKETKQRSTLIELYVEDMEGPLSLKDLAILQHIADEEGWAVFEYSTFFVDERTYSGGGIFFEKGRQPIISAVREWAIQQEASYVNRKYPKTKTHDSSKGNNT